MTVFANGHKFTDVHKVDFEQEDCNVAIIVTMTFADATIAQERVFNIMSVVIHE